MKTGRKLLADNVEKQKSDTIEQATKLAREKLDLEVTDFVQRNLKQLLTTSLIKIIIIALIFITYELQWINATHFAIGAGIMLGVFLCRDIFITWPTARLIIGHLGQHGWRPREAISHYVSAAVFDQALEEVSAATANPKTRLWLTLAGTSHTQVSLEIATAVATIAHETSYEQIKPRIRMAFVRAATIIALYSGIVFVIFRLV